MILCSCEKSKPVFILLLIDFCFFPLQNFTSRADTVFCGVFDGHGPHGHIVARRVRDQLPLKLSAHWEDFRESNICTVGGMNSDGTASEFVEEESASFVDLEGKESVPEIFMALKESFRKAFKVMDKELKLHPSINCFCSGTTAVTLVKQVNEYYIMPSSTSRYDEQNRIIIMMLNFLPIFLWFIPMCKTKDFLCRKSDHSFQNFTCLFHGVPQDQYLVVGNIGDSRAILGTRDHNDQLLAVQLTVDLKPNLPSTLLPLCSYFIFS